MKKALIKILLFLLPMVVCYTLLETRLSGIQNIYNKKRTDLERRLPDIEVLILGASHAFFDLNPDFFSYKAFNLASTYQSEFYDAQLEAMYAGRAPKLKLVIISADFSSFFLQLHDTKEEWRDYYYYQFWNIKYPGLPLLEARKFSKLALYGPERLMDSAISSGININLTYTLHANGWAPYRLSGAYPVNDSTGKYQVDLAYRNFTTEKMATVSGYIEKMIRDLRRRNIQVALISFPVHHSYSDNCPKNVVAMEDSTIREFCTNYGCKYYNYSHDQRFTLADYADNDHIRESAAMRFSKIVDSEVLLPTLKK